MKLHFAGCLAIIILTGITPALFAQPAAQPPHQTFSLKTKSFTLNFHTGDDGRLYQSPVGADNSKWKLQRDDESYPQAGDGYIWEPALQIIHADGNTSTALLYDNVTRTDVAGGRQLTTITLHDPAYPVEVTLNFQTDPDRDVIEQWTTITPHESGGITLERMASTALLLPTNNVYLTHFFGNWAYEMLSPITEPLTAGTKVLDSK